MSEAVTRKATAYEPLTVQPLTAQPVVIKVVSKPIRTAGDLGLDQWFYVGSSKEQALKAVNADARFHGMERSVLPKKNWQTIEHLKQSCYVLDYHFVDVRT